jgi:hypothetical protein
MIVKDNYMIVEGLLYDSGKDCYMIMERLFFLLYMFIVVFHFYNMN